MKNKRTKGRSQHTYEKKIDKLSKVYYECPKIQAKYTIEQWLSQIKKPTNKE